MQSCRWAARLGSGPGPLTRERRLRVVLALNLALIAALVVVGLKGHSLGVLAEGVDYLADAGGIGVALVAIRLAHPKATAVAAFVNAAWLTVLSVLVTVAAVLRLARGARRVDGLGVLVVSGIAAAVMLAGALLLGGDAEGGEVGDRLNVRAVLLDTAADAAAAAGVAAGGGIILWTGGWFWVDPTVALAIAVIFGWHALALLAKVLPELRRHTPPRVG